MGYLNQFKCSHPTSQHFIKHQMLCLKVSHPLLLRNIGWLSFSFLIMQFEYFH